MSYILMNSKTTIKKISNWVKTTDRIKIIGIVCASVVVLFILDICVSRMESDKTLPRSESKSNNKRLTLEDMINDSENDQQEATSQRHSASDLDIPAGDVRSAREVSALASVDLKDDFSDIVCYQRLQDSDISGLSKQQLRILRNTIYARHGRKFKSDDLRNYFSSFDWYRPLYDEISPDALSEIEKHNIVLIRKYE